MQGKAYSMGRVKAALCLSGPDVKRTVPGHWQGGEGHGTFAVEKNQNRLNPSRLLSCVMPGKGKRVRVLQVPACFSKWIRLICPLLTLRQRRLLSGLLNPSVMHFHNCLS